MQSATEQSPTRTPLEPTCPQCGQILIASPRGVATLLGNICRTWSRPGALLDPGDLRYIAPDAASAERERETQRRLFDLLEDHLAQIPVLGSLGCPVCMCTECARRTGDRGDAAREVANYNRASAFRTFYASRLYREVAGEVPPTSMTDRLVLLGVLSFCGFAAQAPTAQVEHA